MNGHTFEDRVRERRKATIFTVLGYFLMVVAVQAALDYFVLYLAMAWLASQARQIIIGLQAVLTLWSFMAAWNAHRSVKSSLDVLVRDMDPIQKEVFIAAVQQDKEKLLKVIKDRGTNLVGSSKD